MAVISTFLVPLDGSWMADRALSYGIIVARAMGARLVLLGTMSGVACTRLDPVRLVASVEQARAQGVAAEVHVEPGDPSDAVLRALRAHRCDLVVVPGRGAPLNPWCTVAQDVVGQAGVPILAVPVDTSSIQVDTRLHRLLVALDGSARAEEALAPACALADALGSELLLLRVIRPEAVVQGGEADGRGPNLMTAREYNERLGIRLRTRGRRVTAFTVMGDPSSMIPAVARAQSADLIAMTTHGEGGSTWPALGGVAARSLHSAGLPLLLVPPGSTQESATGTSVVTRPA
jgi:nucleotide-binding universal stress UspA family protein